MVPPEITSPCTGLPRNMILVSSLYAFGPDLFQALHGASMRHSLKVLAVHVNTWLGPSSAMLGTVAPIDNIKAIKRIECRRITVSDELNGSENNPCTAFRGPPTIAGLPFPLHVHMLRHSTGYALAAKGMDTRRLQHFLGHASITNTVRYTAMSPEPFKDVWR
jgi:integrase-like protein